MIKLWTIRKASVWKSDQKTGFVFNGLGPHVWDSFILPYHWISKQMRERIGRPKRRIINLPVWAWIKKPDLRTALHQWKGKHVLIEFEMEEKDILLSDYDSWHYVLNGWFLGTMKETAKFEAARKKTGDEFCPSEQLPDSLQKIMKDSWVKVFDIKKKSEVQATMWEIPMCNIINVTEFKGRFPGGVK